MSITAPIFAKGQELEYFIAGSGWYRAPGTPDWVTVTITHVTPAGKGCKHHRYRMANGQWTYENMLRAIN